MEVIMSFRPESYNYSLKKIQPHVIETRARLMSDHYRQLETFYNSERATLEERMEKYEKESNVEYDDQKIDYICELITEIEVGYRRNLRMSTVMLAYSFLENSMELICREHEKNTNSSKSVSDMDGKGICRSKNYLKEIAGYDFGKIGEWSRACDLSKVRNCLVHSEGNLDRYKYRDKLSNIVAITKGLEIEEEHLLSVSSEYVLASIDNIKQLLIRLQKS